MELQPEEAFSEMEQRGQRIYFCSKECAEKFREDPDRYLLDSSGRKENGAGHHH
jgi:YHS domain-containing protein